VFGALDKNGWLRAVPCYDRKGDAVPFSFTWTPIIRPLPVQNLAQSFPAAIPRSPSPRLPALHPSSEKHRVLAEVLARNQADESYWYRESELYDEMVGHLFKSRFYRGDHFEICFARRGKSDRTEALKLALDQARRTYERDMGVPSRVSIAIRATSPRHSGGLQSVDYFLWALQRLYEQDEDRYWEAIRSRVKVVYDRDDTRTASYGVYYTPEKPLTRDARAKK